jgi:hypothetical protein
MNSRTGGESARRAATDGDVVVALAGRRTDAPGAAVVRFPTEEVDRVRAAIRECLEREHAVALVSSAAAGADLLAQDVAAEIGLRRHIVLPFHAARFRETSVVDRSDYWGERFDRLCVDVEAFRNSRARPAGHADSIVELPAGDGSDDAAYARANERILADAQRLAGESGTRVVAVLVWDGKPRGPDDLTAAFGDLARARDCAVIDISTLNPPG